MANNLYSSKKEIFDFLVKEKEGIDELKEITSTSNLSLWKTFLGVIAGYIFKGYNIILDAFKTIDESILAKYVGTNFWYDYVIRTWQYGDQIKCTAENFYVPKYDLIDESKQIIKYVSVKEDVGRVYIKVAKDGGGVPTPLSIDELNSFRAYLGISSQTGITPMPNPIRTADDIMSEAGDKITIGLNFVVDGEIYNSQGFNINKNAKDLEDKVKELLSFGVLSQFDGVIYINRVISEVINYGLGNGLYSVSIINCQAENYKGDITNILLDDNMRYSPISGYINEVQVNAFYQFNTIEYTK